MAGTDQAVTDRGRGERCLRLGNDVVLDVQDGIARLLNLNRGRFYGLDPVGTKLLTLVLDDGFDVAVDRAADFYGVDHARIRTDLTTLVGELARKRLLVKHRGPVAATRESEKPRGRRGHGRTTAPGRLTVASLMVLAWFSIRLLGWATTVRLWTRWHRADRGPSPPAGWDDVIDAVDQLVRDAASRRVLLPMVCKERALVGYQILRAVHGLPAVLKVGIRRHPFEAHAWVECGGRVVTDEPENCAIYQPVAHYFGSR